MGKNKYSLFSDRLEPVDNGYIIVENTLFEVRNFNIEDSWEVTGESIEEKVDCARKVADIPKNVDVVYDDEGTYSADIIHDEGKLCTAFDIMLSEDEESLIEYFADL